MSQYLLNALAATAAAILIVAGAVKFWRADMDAVVDKAVRRYYWQIRITSAIACVTILPISIVAALVNIGRLFGMLLA